MSAPAVIIPSLDDDVLLGEFLDATAIPGRHILWLGSASFEERCVGSIERLRNAGVVLTTAVILRYSADVRPDSVAEARRESHRETIVEVASEIAQVTIEKPGINPYSFSAIRKCLTDLIHDLKPTEVIVDISCLTKIHCLAVATMVAASSPELRWSIAYSAPENYGDFNDTGQGGWCDVLIAPLSESPEPLNEAKSRGIVVPGHERERLRLALGEMEPVGGLILLSDTPGRPDWRKTCERRNRFTLQRLSRIRMAQWTTGVIQGVSDLTSLFEAISTEVRKARTSRGGAAPIILFPYGPKWLLFATCVQLCRQYVGGTWFVYPVPSRYQVAYSEGLASTAWFRI